ncbi:MAG TPA: hypothetical protein DEB40_07535 [Elusimicrobia bacterium]|nr:hypothetical protein [Elusimicrobiota bacterium]HBT61580.1 hypothetical protein [Elusimicrobiota bacterium]
MATLLRLMVLVGLIAGAAFSCSHRRKQQLLVKVAQRFLDTHYRYYPGSQDTITPLDCGVKKMTPEEAKDVRHKIPWLGAFTPISGTCNLDITFRDYPRQGETGRLRLQLYYAWAGYNRDWELVERRLLD